MASLPGVPDPEGRVLHGFEHNEDAVILRTPPAGMALVQTVDVLSPLGNNPRLFGQVAAANALSDVYAVGGVPWSAMNIAAFPAQDVPLEVFAEILAGGLEKIVEAGAVLAGGHTLEDAEIKYGLSVTGYVDPGAVASNAGLRPGDALVLTKPLGTGVLATAIKAQWDGSGKAEADLYRWATHLNANAAASAAGHEPQGRNGYHGIWARRALAGDGAGFPGRRRDRHRLVAFYRQRGGVRL